MPKKLLSLEKGGPPRVEISWSGLWSNFTVKVDGAVVITANGSSDIKAGKSAKLPDGSTLDVRLESGFGKAGGLVVMRDGVPLPGSATDPESQVKAAGGVVYAIAVLNLLVAVIAYAFDVQVLKDNFGYTPIFVAALFAVLGYFTMKRSAAALWTAIVLYALDGVLTLGYQISEAA